MESVPDRASENVFTGRRGSPVTAQRCLAKTRRGTPCRRAAERNPITGRKSRCRLHGGLSTGARTPEGKVRAATARLRHGRYSAAAKRAKEEMRRKLEALKKSREEMHT
jgi:hypothetical protein